MRRLLEVIVWLMSYTCSFPVFLSVQKSSLVVNKLTSRGEPSKMDAGKTRGVLNSGKGVCADPVERVAILEVKGPGPPSWVNERQLSPDRGGEKT
jgi:hypothetical protein